MHTVEMCHILEVVDWFLAQLRALHPRAMDTYIRLILAQLVDAGEVCTLVLFHFRCVLIVYRTA